MRVLHLHATRKDWKGGHEQTFVHSLKYFWRSESQKARDSAKKTIFLVPFGYKFGSELALNHTLAYKVVDLGSNNINGLLLLLLQSFWLLIFWLWLRLKSAAPLNWSPKPWTMANFTRPGWAKYPIKTHPFLGFFYFEAFFS